MKLKKNLRWLLFTWLLLIIGLSACKKEETYVPPVEMDNSLESEIPELEEPAGEDLEATEEQTPTGDITESDDKEEDVPVKVLVAKTYKQLHPELYGFYPQEPKLTYTKWVYKIDKQSSFIGSIIYPDGTTVTGNGDVKDEIKVDTGNFTNGGSDDSDSNNDTGINSPQTDKGSKIEGDTTVNPSGSDVVVEGADGSSINVTTKTIANAVVDKTNTNPYVVKFSTGSAKYTMQADTIESTMATLLQDGLYKDISGSVYINTPVTLSTAKGTYTEYTFYDMDGNSYVYAVTYTPRYTANTVYTLYSDKLENNAGLFEILQKMIVE